MSEPAPYGIIEGEGESGTQELPGSHGIAAGGKEEGNVAFAVGKAYTDFDGYSSEATM